MITAKHVTNELSRKPAVKGTAPAGIDSGAIGNPGHQTLHSSTTGRIKTPREQT